MITKKKNIFWLEDDPHSLKDYCEELRKVYDLSIGAHLGIIQQKRKNQFDLILVDLMIHHSSFGYGKEKEVQNIGFPDVHWTQTGVEFLRRIRKGEYETYGFKKNVPVIVATGVVNYPARDETKKHKIKDFLVKPFTIDDLEKSIEKALTLSDNKE